MQNQNLLVTLTTSDLRKLIADVLDEKFKPVKEQEKVQIDPEALYSRIEVANLFGVSKTTIDKWRRHGILPPIVKFASRVYFYKVEIIEAIKRRHRNPERFLNL